MTQSSEQTMACRLSDQEGKMFEVKFGTPKPVRFRECWERGGICVDLDLEARFAAKVEVSNYDGSRYDSEDAVTAKIKADGPEMIAKCLKEDWPENTPIVKGLFKGLEGLFDQELERQGIKAHTEFFSKVLTPDSEESYKTVIDQQTFRDPSARGWDHICFEAIKPPVQEGKYQLRLSDPFLLAKDGQLFHAPGEEVEVEFCAVGSDTSYSFEVSAPNVKYEYGSTIKIQFVMPEHDVTISVGSKPYGPNMDLFEKQLKESVTMGMMQQGWICLKCNTRNTGKFCTECGSPKP